MSNNVVKFQKRKPEKAQRQKTPGQRPPHQKPRGMNQLLVIVASVAVLGLAYSYFSFTAP